MKEKDMDLKTAKKMADMDRYNEPLKNKNITLKELRKHKPSIKSKYNWKFFFEEDVKSAVEWLKEKMKYQQDFFVRNCMEKEAVTLGTALYYIDEAFPDLKTSPNKDFKAQSVSPKVCPECDNNPLRNNFGNIIKCNNCGKTGRKLGKPS